MPYALMVCGLLLLLAGTYLMVRGMEALAFRYQLAHSLGGMTLVSLATATPGLTVALAVSGTEQAPVVLQALVGSSLINTFLILGTIGLTSSLVFNKRLIFKGIPYIILSTVVLLFMVNDGLFLNEFSDELSRWEGAGLLLIFVAYIRFLFRATQTTRVRFSEDTQQLALGKMWAFIGGGFVFAALGGELLVSQFISVAEEIKELSFAASFFIFAPAISFPLLFALIVSLIKKHKGLALGNILGANVFNLTLIPGVCGLVRPIPYEYMLNFDLIFLLAGHLLLWFSVFTNAKRAIPKWESLLLIVFFLGYAWLVAVR